jgi:uncharacterized FlaG/YvyC family protein
MVVDTKNSMANLYVAAAAKPVQKEVRNSGKGEPDVVQAAETGRETKKQIESLIRNFDLSREMSMYWDNDLKRVVVTITDGETARVIRQIPASELISFAKRFKQFIGHTIDRRV